MSDRCPHCETHAAIGLHLGALVDLYREALEVIAEDGCTSWQGEVASRALENARCVEHRREWSR